MKKFLLLALIIFLLPACFLTKNGIVDYNNLVVERIKVTSPIIEESATLYNASIPDVVTEEAAIETEEMQTAFDSATESLEDIPPLLNLESRDLEQQRAVMVALEIYITAAGLYLDTYQEMLDYYALEGHANEVSQVESLDEVLHKNYTIFTEANNDLVETLELFVDGEEETE
jgi:hypothetical protein